MVKSVGKLFVIGLAFALAGCKPDPLQRRAAERGIAQAVSNYVVGITRIVAITHQDGAIDGGAIVEYVNERGGIERDTMFLLFKDGEWGVRSTGKLERSKASLAALEKEIAEQKAEEEQREAMEEAKHEQERQKIHQQVIEEERQSAEEEATLSRPMTITLRTGKTFTGHLLITSATDSGIQVKIGEGEFRRVPWNYFRKSDLESLDKSQKLKPFIDPYLYVEPYR